MLLTITSTSDKLLNGVKNDDLELPKMGFYVFCNFAAHILRVTFAEMAGDRPGQAAYEVFSIKHNNLSFSLLNSRSLLHGGFRFGYFLKTHSYFIARCRLISQVVGLLLSRVT